MIELLLDRYGVEASAEALYLSSPTSYVEFRLKIKKAEDGKIPLKIAVTNPGMFSWFDDLRDDGRVTIRLIDPLKELQSALGPSTAIPGILRADPELIVKWHVLEDVSEKPPLVPIADWILSRRLDPIWSKASLDRNGLADLLTWFTSADWESYDAGLRTLATSRLDAWVVDPALTPLMKWFQTSPQKRSSIFALAQRLAKYPLDRVVSWLGQDAWAELAALSDWASLAAKVSTVELPAIPADINVGVRSYLQLRATEAPDALQDALSPITGHIPGEILALEKISERLNTPLTREFVEWLRTKIGGAHSDLVRAFEELVPSPEPTELPESASGVLAWVRSSYVPYYRWTRRTSQEHLTEQWARGFETWFLKAAEGIFADLQLSTLGVTDYIEKQSEDATLLVIVDGLGYEWAEDFIEILAEQGLSASSEPQARFAVPPSITSYAKPAMIRGLRPEDLPDKSFNSASYYELLKARLPNMAVGAISDIDPHLGLEQLVTSTETGTGLFLYLANGLDDLLHKPLGEQKRRQETRGYLRRLAFTIRNACDRYLTTYGTPLTTVITADHGQTVLPDSAKVLKAPEGSIPSHGRIVELDEFTTLPPAGSILLIPRKWGLKRPILIASGYAYWDVRPPGGVHGGLTPEEMVVPLFRVSLDGVQPETSIALVFSLTGTLRRNRSINNVVLEVVNPNARSVKLLYLTIEGVKVREPLPYIVLHDATISIPATIDTRGIRTEVATLSGSCTYQCGFQTTQQPIQLTVRTTGGAVDDFDMF